MKKILLMSGLCVILLSTPTLFAFPTANEHSLLFSPFKMSDGTFAGGMGRGHWGHGGFNIDTVSAYMNGVYTGSGFIKISGDITNTEDEQIGEINAFIISKIIFGYTRNTQGQQAPIIVILMRHQHDQFVGRILVGTFRSSPNIWGYFIPNT